MRTQYVPNHPLGLGRLCCSTLRIRRSTRCRVMPYSQGDLGRLALPVARRPCHPERIYRRYGDRFLCVAEYPTAASVGRRCSKRAFKTSISIGPRYMPLYTTLHLGTCIPRYILTARILVVPGSSRFSMTIPRGNLGKGRTRYICFEPTWVSCECSGVGTTLNTCRSLRILSRYASRVPIYHVQPLWKSAHK